MLMLCLKVKVCMCNISRGAVNINKILGASEASLGASLVPGQKEKRLA